MKINAFSQRGAVLIFSLLTLLVISILGVGMVQQNRTQFMMVENTQSQATGLTLAENIIRSAEIFIANSRYVNPLPAVIPADCFDGAGQPTACSTYDCNTPGGIFQQLMPGDLGGGAALAGSVSLPSGSSVDIVKTVCVGGGALGLQYQDCSLAGQKFCAYDTALGVNNNPCHTEIYTIRATVVDLANNQRVVESNFAVRCDN